MERLENLAHFYRYIWPEAGLLLVVGDASPIIEGRKVYNARYGIADLAPEHESPALRMICGCSLAAVSLAERESWGWSLTPPGSDFGLFCGIEPEGIVTACIRDAAKKDGLAAVQRQKPSENMVQSSFKIKEDDPVSAVATYFEQSLQLATRLAVNDKGYGVLAQALPEGNIGEVEGLSDEKLIELSGQLAARGELEGVGEVLLFYECRCDDEMILKMITSLPADQRRDLWGDESSLHIECPRCRRAYNISRQKG